jgi:hypothetical protein
MAKRFVSRVRTTLSHEEIEAFLAKHCRNQTSIAVEAAEGGDSSRKVLRIEFANEGDQLLFRVAWKANTSR